MKLLFLDVWSVGVIGADRGVFRVDRVFPATVPSRMAVLMHAGFLHQAPFAQEGEVENGIFRDGPVLSA